MSDPQATGNFQYQLGGPLLRQTYRHHIQHNERCSGGLLNERDVDAQGFIDQLDALAKTIMTQVNDIHESGYNLNQTTDIAFFKPLTQNYAADMDVSDEIQNDVNNIAATSALDRPTDNDIALGIAGLGETNLSFTVNSSTLRARPVDFVSSMLSSVGQLTKNAQDLVTYQTNTMSVLTQQQQAVSGVSLDEELTNLMQYQRAYQASARLISTADADVADRTRDGGQCE